MPPRVSRERETAITVDLDEIPKMKRVDDLTRILRAGNRDRGLISLTETSVAVGNVLARPPAVPPLTYVWGGQTARELKSIFSATPTASALKV